MPTPPLGQKLILPLPNSVVIHRQSTSAIPTPSLADALAAQRKNASTLLTFGSLRKPVPERAPNNALLLDSVLGFDESMLKDILRPHMRGLGFDLTWVVRLSSLRPKALGH